MEKVCYNGLLAVYAGDTRYDAIALALVLLPVPHRFSNPLLSALPSLPVLQEISYRIAFKAKW